MSDEAKGPQPDPEQVDFDRDAVDPVPWVGQVEDDPTHPGKPGSERKGGLTDAGVPPLDPDEKKR